MADKMDIDAVNAEKQEESVGPAPDLPPERIIINNLHFINQAVDNFDSRFTLRALRSIATLRKSDKFAEALVVGIRTAYPKASNKGRQILEELLPESHQANGTAAGKEKDTAEEQTHPEIWAYLGVLVQVYLYDNGEFEKGADFSENFIERIRSWNRRTLDQIGAKAYFYYALFHEELDPKPPSKQSPVIDTRPKLLAALRSAVLRKDTDTQAAVTVLLLRNYISTADITQADLLVAQTQFPTSASNNQVCRYLYYIGRIRAIQLAYTQAHDHLESATRKSPTNGPAVGFYQQATKLLIVVELLMGDIPERSIFRQPALESALYPYLKLVQAVRVGDLQAFLKCVSLNEQQFRKDGTYTLVLRLRQNVIKTGVRMLSLSYSRISLRDICTRLGVDSEESAEYITAKAIRDGVIEASLDHQNGHMVTVPQKDAYSTTEPSDAFHARISALLGMRDECVMAMRYPMNKNRQELAEAAKARDRERELAKEIVEGEGDIDDGDDGGFEGM
ncbi:putative 26S proteasome regulatory subunit rpn3 [Fulvia fulva]|uniref:26S proteasome regulatory subunit rpn3 n=1 Tax=Passalora fulva TaxID=5499 RepID=A0A9Q8UTS8_PASFU|nr:putative 26S proteasome regulatory subunit rpn3 [Fulvia fulva]KAK4613287.1 putative 26S proteasome regulatory subunit rpn3 [Fulvia fulva]KAK4614279.1 putative 26S proteasome regulatory subunit rpn3 [Fulvia fulva]UJO22239.1 putative 26S proteasome regulatory subunit rpn3 [Fulvia fulva]WPV19851.1 putative 26S proteasome regulatory subunit rpn3 [Fulvia fulva]WPV34828.1 putative 26S proteasome regulatory subunit rpn3 [Fulvia fulva]